MAFAKFALRAADARLLLFDHRRDFTRSLFAFNFKNSVCMSGCKDSCVQSAFKLSSLLPRARA
jgi:hypothetical protein